MSVSIAPVQGQFVATVSGVDLTEELDQSTFDRIEDAFHEYAVLVFHGQSITDEQQIEFSARFGPIETAPNYAGAELRVGENITDISNLDFRGNILDPDDRLNRYNVVNQEWHTDSSFKARRAKCSLLSAREVPESGGETEFADLRTAYDDLPDEMKALVKDLVAEHSIEHSRRNAGFDSFNSDIKSRLPPVPQVVSATHVGSGRPTLYLASHASHILGMPREEGQHLLKELIAHATQEQYVYQHDWKVGDLVMWDNRCTMHRGRPYNMLERRVLHRTTVADFESPFEQDLEGE